MTGPNPITGSSSRRPISYDEAIGIVEQLQAELETLVVRGLRAAGPENRRALETLRDEFARIGAAHLAGRIEALLAGLQSGERGAAAALMRAQASLRLFERVLSTRAAAEALGALRHGSGQAE